MRSENQFALAQQGHSEPGHAHHDFEGLSGRELSELLSADYVPGAEATREIVINTTLLRPGRDRIDEDIARANELYGDQLQNPIRIVRGETQILEVHETMALLGLDFNVERDEASGDMLASKEMLDLTMLNRTSGQLTGYWVPHMNGLRGMALPDMMENVMSEQESVIINTKTATKNTFAHELGHVLGSLEHHDDSGNLMASGDNRTPNVDSWVAEEQEAAWQSSPYVKDTESLK